MGAGRTDAYPHHFRTMAQGLEVSFMTYDDLIRYAFEWFGLGLLWLFVSSVLLGLVAFIKRVLG
jgi:hypothetical protein